VTLGNELDPLATVLELVPFLTIQTMTDEIFSHGKRTYIKAGFARDLTDGLLDALLEQASQVGSPLSQVEVLSVGGAIAAVDPAATAFPHRDAHWLLNIRAMWESPDDSEAEIAWARATCAAIQPHLSGGTYVNFMDDDEDGAGMGAHAATLERLQAVKAVYDPGNVFRLNQNIAPAVGARG
jgi:hypothetical protein